MQVVNQKSGDTFFHTVVMKGFEETRHFCGTPAFNKDLLEVSNNLKQRPLHLAVASLDAPLVEYLLEKGASVDAFKKGDWTPLMIASTSSKIQAAKIVHILLRHRANPELKNKDGWTAMHLACKAGNIDVVMQLASAKSSLLTEPSRSGRISLHIAALNGHTDLVNNLIELGGQQLYNAKDSCGSTPAMDAVISGCMLTLKKIGRHADLANQTDRLGFSCMHKAAILGHTQLVEHLVQAGLSVNAHTKCEGYTPLHLAVLEKHPNTVLELLAHGADPTLHNNYKQTVFDLPRGLPKSEVENLIAQGLSL